MLSSCAQTYAASTGSPRSAFGHRMAARSRRARCASQPGSRTRTARSVPRRSAGLLTGSPPRHSTSSGCFSPEPVLMTTTLSDPSSHPSATSRRTPARVAAPSGRHQHALGRRARGLLGQDVRVVDRDRRAARVPADRRQDQEVTERGRHVDAERHRRRVLPRRRPVSAPSSKARTIGAQPLDCTATSRGSLPGASRALDQLRRVPCGCRSNPPRRRRSGTRSTSGIPPARAARRSPGPWSSCPRCGRAP